MDSFKSLSYDPNNEYTVPYTWGMVGLVYNTKYITEEEAKNGKYKVCATSDISGLSVIFE